MNDTILHYPLPDWVSLLFLISIPLPFILILALIRTLTHSHNMQAVFTGCVLFFVLYLAYIAVASYWGWFEVVSMPPRVLLLTTFPYAFFLFGVVLRSQTYRGLYDSVTLESLIRLHIFRLIGVFFILLALYEGLPKPFAYIAGSGDILTAVSALFVANVVERRRPHYKRIALFWNIFGAVDILFTAAGANALTFLSIKNGTMGVDTLATFPFCIIPAFAPPTILFLHWAIYQKLRHPLG